MQSSIIAHKYAKALFDAALEENSLDRVGADVASLAGLREEDEAFVNFLESPEVLTEHKLEFIEKVFGPRMSHLAANFLRLLVDKGRINYLLAACREFQHLAEEHRGIVRAEVLTAVPLSGEQEDRLKRELDRITGKNIILEKRIDRAILGGVVVHLGNRIIDRSLRHGLKRIGENLLHAEVN